eukprot:GILJ01013912.1.p1 GENE.GILJ01013912.1~~GILJ01013912.1.p1  ORF type:complete len:105 (+),score=15.66 GILJ01013912.1:132-446(+)
MTSVHMILPNLGEHNWTTVLQQITILPMPPTTLSSTPVLRDLSDDNKENVCPKSAMLPPRSPMARRNRTRSPLQTLSLNSPPRKRIVVPSAPLGSHHNKLRTLR